MIKINQGTKQKPLSQVLVSFLIQQVVEKLRLSLCSKCIKFWIPKETNNLNSTSQLKKNVVCNLNSMIIN